MKDEGCIEGNAAALRGNQDPGPLRGDGQDGPLAPCELPRVLRTGTDRTLENPGSHLPGDGGPGVFPGHHQCGSEVQEPGPLRRRVDHQSDGGSHHTDSHRAYIRSDVRRPGNRGGQDDARVRGPGRKAPGAAGLVPGAADMIRIALLATVVLAGCTDSHT